MSIDTESGAAVMDEEREITAKFSRDELVRGWRERESRAPRVVPYLRFAARTDLGRIRENNEDKFDFYEVEDLTLLAARGSFYAVADGMGGHAAGQIASELALKNVVANYYDSPTEEIPTALLESISAANEAIYNIAVMIPERSGMGTTLTAAVFAEDRVYVAQVGDSRAYLMRDGEIRQVTFEHSWVAEHVRMGGMTSEEAELSPYRNVITRALGTQASVEPEVFVEEARAGDLWVLCTDGLTGHVADSEILQVAAANPPAESARQLIELANARGGRDNITVFVISIRDLMPVHDSEPSDSPPVEPAQEPKRRLKRLFGK